MWWLLQDLFGLPAHQHPQVYVRHTSFLLVQTLPVSRRSAAVLGSRVRVFVRNVRQRVGLRQFRWREGVITHKRALGPIA